VQAPGVCTLLIVEEACRYHIDVSVLPTGAVSQVRAAVASTQMSDLSAERRRLFPTLSIMIVATSLVERRFSHVLY